MRKIIAKLIVISAALTFVISTFGQGDPNFEPNLPIKLEPVKTLDSGQVPSISSGQVKAARIVCEGMIDNGLYESIKRRTEEAIAEGRTYIIYEIDTYGGLVISADAICEYLLFEVANRANTVAYVTKKAISAGAMISVSCEDIIMLENTTIGDCAPMSMGAELEGVEREKTESFIRAVFDRAAEKNKYPQALLRAMVTMQLKIYRAKDIETDEYVFFEEERLTSAEANGLDMANKELIVKDDEILTLTASRAEEYGIARAVVRNFEGALKFLEVRDSVKIERPVPVRHTNWSEELVRFINSPAVMGVLVLLAFLGVYMELNTPGLGLPGLIAVLCFTIIVGSKFLIGMANWIEVAILVLGIILLLIEFFVIPGFGVTGLAGIFCIIFGLFAMLVKNAPSEIPWPQSELAWDEFYNGALGMLIGFFSFMIVAFFVTRYLPKFGMFTGLSLSPAIAKKGDENEVSMTIAPQAIEQQISIGVAGEVVTPLRPAGRARFGEAIVDVTCEGEFVDSGDKVEIIKIKGNRVVVRKLPEA